MSVASGVRTIGCGLALAATACGGDDPVGTVAVGATLGMSLTGLAPLDVATGGRYEAWVVDRVSTRSRVVVRDEPAIDLTDRGRLPQRDEVLDVG